MAPSLTAKAKAAKETGQELAHQALGACRARASTISNRLHLPDLGNDGAGFAMVRGLPRSLTAAAQPCSTRRISISSTSVHAGSSTAALAGRTPDSGSPTEMQQVRYRPETPYWTDEWCERWVARNHNPGRDDEYASFSTSSGGSEADASLAGADVIGHEAVVAEASRHMKEVYSVTTVANGRGDLRSREDDRMPSQETSIPQFETDAEADLESQISRGIESRDFWKEAGLATRLHEPPASSTSTPASRRHRERRQGIIFDAPTAHTICSQTAPILPSLPELAPQPRRRSRPLVRDPQRRQGRIWDSQTDHVVLTALANATNTSLNEGISPHLSGQELEARRPPWPEVRVDVAYTETDTSRYRNLTGVTREGRKLAPPPPPEPIVTIPARILDAETGREVRDVGRRDGDASRPEPLIQATQFHPVIGQGSRPHQRPEQDTASVNLSDALTRVEGYIASGAEVVASRVTHPKPLPPLPSQPPGLSSHPASRSPPQQPTATIPREQPKTPSKEIQNGHMLRATAHLILTDQEFPGILTRDGPGSRLPTHLLRSLPPPRAVVVERQIPRIARTSPTPSLSSFGGGDDDDASVGSEEDSISSSNSWNSETGVPSSPTDATSADGSVEGEGEEEEEGWTPLTVRTSEWLPFRGDWIEGFVRSHGG